MIYVDKCKTITTCTNKIFFILFEIIYLSYFLIFIKFYLYLYYIIVELHDVINQYYIHKTFIY